MVSNIVISIEDLDICREVAERMLARGVRVIERPPTVVNDYTPLEDRLRRLAEFHQQQE